MPRFQGENFQENLAIADELGEIARAKGVTPAQLAIAWVLAQGENIIALVGTKSRDHLVDDLDATGIELTQDDFGAMDAILQRHAVAGERYAPAQMQNLDG